MVNQTARGEQALERSLFIGITAFRWAALVWMAITLSIDVANNSAGVNDSVARPISGYALVGVALAFTVWSTLTVRSHPERLHTLGAVVVDLAIASALVLLDPWIYQSDHSQRLGNNWAIASVLSAGVVYAGRGGFAAGITIGMARFVGIAAWETSDGWLGDQALSVVSGVVIYSLAGAVAGFAAIKLREAEREISAARAREEVARTLHDGVLQTLAVVQRRSEDDELVALAREQEHELREFLFGGPARPDSLGPTLRRAVMKFERVYPTRVDLVLADDLPKLPATTTEAVSGAVTEALTNAGKHGAAGKVTVYAEPDGRGVFCSVKDDGSGFDVDATAEGIGLSKSIRGRLTDIGGRVEIVSRPDRGTDVRLWTN